MYKIRQSRNFYQFISKVGRRWSKFMTCLADATPMLLNYCEINFDITVPETFFLTLLKKLYFLDPYEVGEGHGYWLNGIPIFQRFDFEVSNDIYYLPETSQFFLGRIHYLWDGGGYLWNSL